MESRLMGVQMSRRPRVALMRLLEILHCRKKSMSLIDIYPRRRTIFQAKLYIAVAALFCASRWMPAGVGAGSRGLV